MPIARSEALRFRGTKYNAFRLDKGKRCTDIIVEPLVRTH
jgi:hypothetical protein